MVSFLATPTQGIYDTAERVHDIRNLGQREAETRATHRNTILDGHSIRDSRKVVDEHNRALTANQNFALSTAQGNASRDAEYRRLLAEQNANDFGGFTGFDDYDNPRDDFTSAPTQMQGAPILSGAGAPPSMGGATTPAPTPGGQYTTQIDQNQQVALPPNPTEALNVTADLPVPGAGAPADPLAYQQGGFGAGAPGAPPQTMADVQASLDTRVANARTQGLATAGAPPAPQPQNLGQSDAVTKALTQRDQARTFHTDNITLQENQLRQAMQLAQYDPNPQQAQQNIAALQQQLLITKRSAQLEMDIIDTGIYSKQGENAVDALRAGDARMVSAILGQKYGGAQVSITPQGNGQYAITVGNNVVAIDNLNGIDTRVREVSVAGFIERQAEYLSQLSEQRSKELIARIGNPASKLISDGQGGVLAIHTDPNGNTRVFEVRKDIEGLDGKPKTGIVPAGTISGGASGGFTTTDFLNLTQ